MCSHAVCGFNKPVNSECLTVEGTLTSEPGMIIVNQVDFGTFLRWSRCHASEVFEFVAEREDDRMYYFVSAAVSRRHVSPSVV